MHKQIINMDMLRNKIKLWGYEKMVLRLTRFFQIDLNNNFYIVHDKAWFESLHTNPGEPIEACTAVDVEREMWLCWRFGQDWPALRSHSISSGWPLDPAVADRSGSWLGRGQRGPDRLHSTLFWPVTAMTGGTASKEQRGGLGTRTAGGQYYL